MLESIPIDSLDTLLFDSLLRVDISHGTHAISRKIIGEILFCAWISRIILYLASRLNQGCATKNRT